MRRRCLLALALTLAGLVASPALAAAGSPLGLGECGETERVYQCSGLVATWDGVPLDTTLTLPREGARHLPLVAELNGFGNSKYEYLDPASHAYTGNAFSWARRGYAVLTYTARGQWGSCGTLASRLASPAACLGGYLHLADLRYEVRDTQQLIGLLVDAGVADAKRIGVTGDSYGGGQSAMLAALSDRVALPDGRLVRWRSPAGKPLRLAAAAPVIPWTDLVTAAAPNGRVSSTAITPRARATSPVGVEKTTFVNAIFAAGQFATGPGQPTGDPFIPGFPMGYMAVPGTDPDADIASIVARTDLGEPYDDAEAKRIVALLARYHSAYYVDPSHRPPPLFLASGTTDDLFPADEVLRYAKRTHKLYPRLPLSLLLGDFGHQRAANKPRERELLLRDIRGWFARYLRDRRRRGPRPGVVAFGQSCPRERPSIGPFRGASFRSLARRKLRRSFPGSEQISSGSGDLTVGLAIDPVTGGGDGCAETAAARAPGTARYRLWHSRRRGRTLIGAPRLRATLAVSGASPAVAQLDARLWDVSPEGKQRLVSRGQYRPREGRQSWQLHPNGWRFRRGHEAVLELQGADIPFARPSNLPFRIDVSGLRVTLPTRG